VCFQAALQLGQVHTKEASWKPEALGPLFVGWWCILAAEHLVDGIDEIHLGVLEDRQTWNAESIPPPAKDVNAGWPVEVAPR
tara:strand:+ start:1758 stop:2003 length:246 start_codon:yes stop_codon:yes gene_type:complete